MPQPTRPRQRQRPAARPQEPKSDWRLIEGDTNRVLAAIKKMLEQTGDDFFSVEFRIFESEGGEKKSPPRARPGRRTAKKKKSGNVFTTFFTRKKTKKSSGRAARAKKARRRK